MNTSLLAQNAYAPHSTSIRTHQSIEYDAFAKVTSALKKAEASADRAQALHQNRSLWTILASDVADPDNELPASLRAQIFYLAEFTSQHTRKVLKNEADAAVLIDINMAVMGGLRQRSNAG